ncbi:MAG: hypothetical protein FD135_5159, partial [Comamonadaceae bacterium]
MIPKALPELQQADIDLLVSNRTQ